MDYTELLLSNINAGKLQRLARDFFIRTKPSWSNITIIGGVEGTDKTRSGIPDVRAEDENGRTVFIEVTTDNRRAKVVGDVTSCIEKLGSNTNSKIISFLSFDPTDATIKKCKELCQDAEIEYDYYTHSSISNVLKNEYPELKVNFLENTSSNKMIEIDMLTENVPERLKYVLRRIEWLTNYAKDDAFDLLFELIDNAVKHGNATSMYMYIDKNIIRLIDNGKAFNLEVNEPQSGVGGGKFTLDEFKRDYEGTYFYNYQHIQGRNVNSIAKSKLDEIILETNEKCSIKVPYFQYGPSQMYKYVYKVKVTEECDPVILDMTDSFPPISVVRLIVDEVILKIPEYKKIHVKVPKRKKDSLERYLKSNGLDTRVKVITN